MVKNKVVVLVLLLFATILSLSLILASTADFSTPTTLYGSGSYLNVSDLTINVTSNDTTIILNGSINLYNSTDLIDQINFTNMTIQPFITTFVSLADGFYFFDANLTNTTGDIINSETRNVTIDITKPIVSYVTPSSAEGYQTTREIIVNISSTESNPGVIIVNISNSSWSNKTVSSLAATSVYLSFTNLSDGAYSITATSNDSAGNVNSTTRSITIDTIAPHIRLISPDDDDTWDSDDRVDFEYNVTDVGGIANCSLYIDEHVNGTADTTVGSGSISELTSTSLDDDIYYDWRIGCKDNAGNTNYTDPEWEFYLDYASDSEDSSDGGGSDYLPDFWTSTYSPSESNLTAGYLRELSKGWRVRFKVGQDTHYVGVLNITSGKVTVNVSSIPQTAVLNVGETKKFEVSGDSYYDVSVTIDSIAGSKANVTVKTIYEKMPASTSTTGATPETAEEDLTTAESLTTSTPTTSEASGKSLFKSAWFWVIVVVLVLALAGTIYYLFFGKKLIAQRSVKIRES